MDIMSNIQALSSNTSFRELLRKFRQEQASSSFMSWFSHSTEELPTTSTSFWWENNSEKEEPTLDEKFFTSPSSFPMGECDTCSSDDDGDELDNASSHSYWLGCEHQEDQDNASFSSSVSHDEYSSDDVSISSASSTYSNDDDLLEEKYLPALGWWKIYRSGWWEHSEGASTHFDETYVEYRYSALLPSIPENGATSP